MRVVFHLNFFSMLKNRLNLCMKIAKPRKLIRFDDFGFLKSV